MLQGISSGDASVRQEDMERLRVFIEMNGRECDREPSPVALPHKKEVLL